LNERLVKYCNELPIDIELIVVDDGRTAILLRFGIRPFEVPTSYYNRSHAEGKKINRPDAFAGVAILFLKVRMRRRKHLLRMCSIFPYLSSSQVVACRARKIMRPTWDDAAEHPAASSEWNDCKGACYA
jgi:hypothetical protein